MAVVVVVVAVAVVTIIDDVPAETVDTARDADVDTDALRESAGAGTFMATSTTSASSCRWANIFWSELPASVLEFPFPFPFPFPFECALV